MSKLKHKCSTDHTHTHACQTLLDIIKSSTNASVDFLKMLQGTDPQKWIKTPFDCERLFLKNWMRCGIEDWDIIALCNTVKRCKPLMKMFDYEQIAAGISYMEKILNRVPSGMETAESIHKGSDEGALETQFLDDDSKLEAKIPKLKDNTRELRNECEEMRNNKVIIYMRSELNQLSSNVETAESINKGHEDKLEAKTPTENESQSDDVTKSGCSDVINRAVNPVPEEESISSTRHRNWYIIALAFRYLTPAFLSVVQDKINSVHKEIVSQYGRLTCAKATADDLESKGNMVQFKHTDCPGQVYDCQTFLSIIKSFTVKSDKLFKMLEGTKPQKWLKTPFDFACLFIPPWLRRRIENFKGCDVSALCAIVIQFNPLTEMFDEKQINAVQTARNKTMHSPDMEITEQDMKDNVEVIRDLLNHMKSLKNTEAITKAIDFINQLRAGNVNLLQSQMVQLKTECLPETGRELLHKLDKNSKVEQLRDEINTLKDENRKLEDETRELKNQLEDVRKT